MPHREATLRVWVGGTITLLWAVSFIADMFIADYDPPSTVGTLMLLVAGALFGEGIVRQVRRTSEHSNDK